MIEGTMTLKLKKIENIPFQLLEIKPTTIYTFLQYNITLLINFTTSPSPCLPLGANIQTPPRDLGLLTMKDETILCPLPSVSYFPDAHSENRKTFQEKVSRKGWIIWDVNISQVLEFLSTSDHFTDCT